MVLWLVGFNKGIVGFLFGFFWSILVMFGLYWVVILFFVIDVVYYGYDVINLLIFVGGLVVLGFVIGVVIWVCDEWVKSMLVVVVIFVFFGINEFVFYGVLILCKKVLLILFFVVGIGGVIVGFLGLKFYLFGVSGILGLLCFINLKGIDVGFIGLCISGIVVFVFVLIVVLIVGVKKDVKLKLVECYFVEYSDVYVLVVGESFDLMIVYDDVFLKLVLGDGIVVKFSDGKVYVLVIGIVWVVYLIGYVVGLVSDDGEEVLIYIGIDMVNFEGKYFKMYVV